VAVLLRLLATLFLAAVGPPAAVGPTPGTGAAPSATAPAPIVHVVDEKERVELEQTDNVRLSMPTESDRAAWASSGLRVALGYGYGIVTGAGPAWSFRSQTALIRPSFRLDEHWELGVTMLYATGPGGVRWSVTAEPTLFLWRQLGISAGVGYGGLFISNSNVNTGTLASETVSRTLSDSDHLSSCTGSALTSALRAQYLFVTGSLFASGPFADLNEQWTECTQSFGQVDKETGRAVVLTQWWRQTTATFGWWFSWR
jgi:hypothetical protein